MVLWYGRPLEREILRAPSLATERKLISHDNRRLYCLKEYQESATWPEEVGALATHFWRVLPLTLFDGWSIEWDNGTVWIRSFRSTYLDNGTHHLRNDLVKLDVYLYKSMFFVVW